MTLHENLALVYQEFGKHEEAMEAYNKVLEIDPNRAISLKNLAWLLVTAFQDRLRDEARALDPPKKALSLERSPVFLDTLAEAYYVVVSKRRPLRQLRKQSPLKKETHNTIGSSWKISKWEEFVGLI